MCLRELLKDILGESANLPVNSYTNCREFLVFFPEQFLDWPYSIGVGESACSKAEEADDSED